MKKFALFLSLIAILIIASGCVKSSSPATTQFPEVEDQVTNSVQIIDFAFQPDEITIKKGETITWTNQDEEQHTVTSDEGTELDSELLSNGQTYSHTFNEAGTFPYHCTPHPFMTAKIIVE